MSGDRAAPAHAPAGDAAARSLIETHLAGRSQDAEAVRELGHDLARRGEYTLALPVLARAVELAPADVEIRLSQLQAAANSEDRAGGAALAEAALAAMPDDPRVAHFAARALRKNRNFARAAELWRRVAQARPSDPAPLIDAAGCLVRAKDYAGALDCADQALARDEASSEACALQIEALRSLNRPEALERAVERLAALDAARVLDHLPALMAAGRYEAVAALLLRCRAQGIALDARLLGQLLRILRNVVPLSQAEGRLHEAALIWRVLADHDRDDATAQAQAQGCLDALAEGAEERATAGDAAAPAALRQVLALAPGHAAAARRLAECLEARADWPEAAETWLAYAAGAQGADRREGAARAVTLAHRIPGSAERLDLLRRAGGLDPADATLQSAIRDIAARCMQTLSDAIEAGRLAEATACAVALRALDPDHGKLARLIRRLLARLSADLRVATARDDVGAGVALARMSVAVDPGNEPALRHLADGALKGHRFAEAARHYERLRELEPRRIRHLERLGQCYRNLRDHAKAAEVFARILDLDPGHAAARERLDELRQRLGGAAATA